MPSLYVLRTQVLNNTLHGVWNSRMTEFVLSMAANPNAGGS